MKGLERAIEAGVKSIAIFTAASETFNMRNINMTIDESFANYAPVAARENAFKQAALDVMLRDAHRANH